MIKKRAHNQNKNMAPWIFGVVFLFCSFVHLGLHTPAAQAVNAVPAHATQESLSLAPYLEVYEDTTGALQIEDIQQPQIQSKFRPFNMGHIYAAGGNLWLRFTLAGNDGGVGKSTSGYLLDMGHDIAPFTQLFVPTRNVTLRSIDWQKYSPTMSGVFLMPEQQNVSLTVYVRVDAVPSLWFSPMLRTPHNAATSLELMAKPMAIMALGIVMILCLLRGFTDKGQWRYWAALYTFMALLHAIMGVPAGYSLSMGDLASVLAPGVALILLPHVARHVMNTPQKSRTIDVQYMLFSLVGALVALLPLVPGFGWLLHYMELWPLLTLCFVPTTLAAWMSGFEGSRRFLFSCLLPPLGVAVALLGLLPPVGFAMFSVAMLSALPLWGVALGSLLMAGTASPSHVREAQESSVETTLPTLESLVQSDPNLRLVPVEEAQSVEPEPETVENEGPKRAISKLEEQLRWPVEQLSRHMATLEECALPVSAREALGELSQASRDITAILHAPAKERMNIPTMAGIEEYVFDLQSLLRQAHDCVSPVADKKNIALSWFMPPHLAQCYKGDALQLLYVLRLLLESSVRATHRGAVQLAVRSVPESVNPGHLLFTVTDTGTGKPPQERSVTALARAWELSASYRGFLGVESNAHGATISFTVHCEVSTGADREVVQSSVREVPKQAVILVSDIADDRQMWAFFLEKMTHPHNVQGSSSEQDQDTLYAVMEARTMEEAQELYKEHGAALLIYDARMPMASLEQGLRALYATSQKNAKEFPLCMAMYAPENVQIEESEGQESSSVEDVYRALGFAHALALPVTKQRLYDEVQLLLNGDEVQKPEGPQCRAFMDIQEQSLEEAEEIIDTGIPILDLHGESQDAAHDSGQNSSMPPLADMFSQASAPAENYEGKASLSEAILLGDEAPQAFSEQEAISVVKAMEAEIEEVLAAQQLLSEQRNTYSAEEESIIDDLLQSAEASVVAENHTTFSRPAPAEDKSNAAYLTSLLDMGDMGDGAEEEPAPTIPPVVPPVVSPVVPSKDSLRPQALTKPKGTVPYEPRAVDFGSGEVGEPMPVGSTLLNHKEGQVSAAPIFAAPSQAELNEEVEAATQQLRAAVLQEKKTPASAKKTTNFADSFTDDWVGEPMPIATQVSEEKQKGVHEEDDPLSMTPLGAKAEGQLPDLHFHRDEDAEKRGRQELSTLQKYMNKLMGRSDKKEPAKAEMADTFLPPLSEVGEPMPVVKNEAQPQAQADAQEAASLSSLSPMEESMAFIKEFAQENSPKSAGQMQEEAPQKSEPLQKMQEVVEVQDLKEEPSFEPDFELETNEQAEEEAFLFGDMPEDQGALVDVVVDSMQEPPMQQESAAQEQINKPARASSPFDWVKEESKEEPQQEAQPEPQQEHGAAPSVTAYAPTLGHTEPAEQAEQVELSPIEQLVVDLDGLLAQAHVQLAKGRLHEVEASAAAMANSAEAFGLRTLGRLSRTVEAAAKAQDVNALQDLLPELDMSVQRNKAALKV